MQKNNNISLPLGECLLRSFIFVAKNAKVLFYICAGWFGLLIFEAICGFPLIESIYTENEESLPSLISGLLLIIASTSILVGTCKVIINKFIPKFGAIYFGKAELSVLGYSFLIAINFIAMLLIATISISIVFQQNPDKDILNNIIFYVIIYAIFIMIVRYSLIYPARSVNDKEMSLKKSFKLTKGNSNKLAWGIIILSAPFVILSQLFTFLYVTIDMDNFIAKFIYCALLMFCSFGDSVLRASFYAHAYQYFIFYDKKENIEIKNED